MRAQPAAFSECLELFSHAEEEEAYSRYLDLLLSVWSDGSALPGAPRAAEDAAEKIRQAPDGRRGHLALLLGLLTETGEPGLRRRVRAGLHHYLALLDTLRDEVPLGTALVYLLAHFPEDADRILPTARKAPLDPDDLARLERCLASFDPESPGIGRSWPSPARWVLSHAERDQERRWLATLGHEAKTAFWEKDTRTLLAYMGAKAACAVATGRVESEAPAEVDPVLLPDRAAAEMPQFNGHLDLMHCPACRGRLSRRATGVVCRDCAVGYPARQGYLDLSGEAVGTGDQIAGNSPLYLSWYEPLLRPAFLRVNGTNWNGAVSVADEDRYLAEHVRPVDGPLLDLGAGTGRWTQVLTRILGGERVVAFDLAATMAARLTKVVPDSLVVRGSGGGIPFADGSLGAVNCWNTVQSIDQPFATVREVGRCLGKGGTFTMLTYRKSHDPLYRYFQRQHEECLGVAAFDQKEMNEALDSAEMDVVDEYTPGTFLIVTAVRR
ncbi:methyltransferase domain-containing protein [Streptomyces marispadix]|uniref:Methyltransferase domain-containing protein n=1 Tax=Streptomyces marispadix TaxID=2922868 RepID=A0ABS9SUI0_9ACTN|nr:methyltransferase domain-containing protein [Streptomyces marispadix]MCH6159934.1 methyltransferase domain-containing protein [Streptomyces marispadix]